MERIRRKHQQEIKSLAQHKEFQIAEMQSEMEKMMEEERAFLSEERQRLGEDQQRSRQAAQELSS